MKIQISSAGSANLITFGTESGKALVEDLMIFTITAMTVATTGGMKEQTHE